MADINRAITNRISYLESLAVEDPNEPSINMESLQRFKAFIGARPQMPCPRIGLTHEGFIEIAWDTSAQDLISMYFLPNGDVRFAVILGTPEATVLHQQHSIDGLLAPDDMMKTIRPFVNKLIDA